MKAHLNITRADKVRAMLIYLKAKNITDQLISGIISAADKYGIRDADVLACTTFLKTK